MLLHDTIQGPERQRGLMAQVDEIKRLQGCINNLVSLLALPALWSGHKPLPLVNILLDVLVRMLRLDFAYARLHVHQGDTPLDAYRVPSNGNTTRWSLHVARALEPWLRADAPSSAHAVPNPLGNGEISIARAGLGLDQDMGAIVVGARRADFPTDVEALLLKVAVNQAAIEVQREQVIAERNRAEASENLKNRLHAENIYLRQELDAEQHWGEIVGQCKALKSVLRLVEQVAPTHACVLIEGETGTGKELIARAIHRMSDRRDQAFVKLNCAAIPTGLLEAELFGHEKGAFTGAVVQKRGRFELADGGTMFLDEVGDIPLELQTKLLRVLQEQEFERLGSTRTQRVDVRLVAASNRDLAQMSAQREFRSDLYYRLKVFPIKLPPLRERVDDIPLLVQHFTQRHARQNNKPITSITADTMNKLCRYPWPGNVRELENFIERSVILSQGPTLNAPLGELRHAEHGAANTNTLEEIERQHILRTLEQSNWVIGGADGCAEKLGMKRTSLQYRMQKLGISRPQ